MIIVVEEGSETVIEKMGTKFGGGMKHIGDGMTGTLGGDAGV